jgi:uncharacterized membrane protein
MVSDPPEHDGPKTTSPGQPAETERSLLRRHIDAWRRDGLISDEQADALLVRVAAAPGEAEPGEPAHRPDFQVRSMGRGVTLLVNFGAVVLALGLVIFFASNWAEIGRAMRIVCLLALTGGFQAGGYLLARPARFAFPKLGVALVALGCLLFGASIYLIASLYSLHGPPTQSVAIFCLASFALAYLVRSRLILALALILLHTWFGMQVGYAWGAYWLCFWKPVHYLGLGILLLVAGAWQARRGAAEFRNTYLLVGLLTVYISLLILSQRDAQDWREPFLWLTEPAILTLLVLPYLLALLGVAAIYRWPAGRALHLYSPPVVLSASIFAVLVLTSGVAFTGSESRYWWMALLTLLAIAGVYLGIAWRSPVILNTSLTFLVIDIYTRYFEWFWDAMPKSLFFIFGGAAFIVGGIYLERVRRRFVVAFDAAAAGRIGP